jgi:hypothetical protein
MLSELRRRIINITEDVIEDRLERVWQEWEYNLDICSVTHAAYIESI